MATYEMLVTDVTNYGSRFCVAGQCVDGTMIRPEPAGARAAAEASRFWEAGIAGPGKFFSIGNVVKFEAGPGRADFAYPHRTEDRLVTPDGGGEILETIATGNIPARAIASLSASVEAAFDGGLVQAASGKAFVPNAFQGRSLGAVEVETQALNYHINTFTPGKPKLRAYLENGGRTFDVAVTSDSIHRDWHANGMESLSAALNNHTRAHVRLGLSRPFAARPNECYLQINGIYLFD